MAKLCMSNFKHLRGESILGYAEKHMSKDVVREIKKDIKDNTIMRKGFIGDIEIGNIAYHRQNIEVRRANVDEKYRNYKACVGDKRSKNAVWLRKRWTIACLSLLYSEFKLCWVVERMDALGYVAL
jgi:hypothetical protein